MTEVEALVGIRNALWGLLFVITTYVAMHFWDRDK